MKKEIKISLIVVAIVALFSLPILLEQNKNDDNDLDNGDTAYKLNPSYNDVSDSIEEDDELTAIIFGMSTCQYCTMFEPVFNKLAEEKDVETYYYILDQLTELEYNEYMKLVKSDIRIPAACSSDGEEKSLDSSFGTPLTLITKDNKVVDCISGYVPEEDYANKLEENGL